MFGEAAKSACACSTSICLRRVASPFPVSIFTRFTGQAGRYSGQLPHRRLAGRTLEKSSLRRILSGGTLAKIVEQRIQDRRSVADLSDASGSLLDASGQHLGGVSAVRQGTWGHLRRQLQRQHVDSAHRYGAHRRRRSRRCPHDCPRRSEIGLQGKTVQWRCKTASLDTYTRLHYSETLGEDRSGPLRPETDNRRRRAEEEARLTLQQLLGGKGE